MAWKAGSLVRVDKKDMDAHTTLENSTVWFIYI